MNELIVSFMVGWGFAVCTMFIGCKLEQNEINRLKNYNRRKDMELIKLKNEKEDKSYEKYGA